jgi:dihydropteroate synthase
MRTVDAAGLPIGDGHPPRIVGVLNLSPESPYDPSVFADPGRAATYVDEELVAEGADIVDVGLESANKRFSVLSAEEELDRLDAAIEVLESVSGDVVFSIETRYHEVADAALAGGFDMVNDICGFADPEMPAVCAEYDAAVVKMASPPDLTRPGAIESVDGIYTALERGDLTEKTIVDPAFGGWSAGKTTAVDRETFERLGEFRGLDRPILVSINRKNFLKEIAGRSTDEALPTSLAATAMAVSRGVHAIRTHDVAATRDAALVGAAFTRDRASIVNESVTIEELDAATPREVGRYRDRIGADADPEDAVTRVFELRGLLAADRGTLAELARTNGATVAAGAPGTDRDGIDRTSTGDTDDEGTASALLIGSVAAFRRVAAAIENDRDGTERLGAVAEAVRAAIE